MYRLIWQNGVDTKENYLKAMEKHYQEHEVSSMEEVEKTEAELNNHSRCIAKIISLGKEAGKNQTKRCNNALIVKNCGLPTLYGMRKDHKEGWDKELGPPMRPLCNGKLGPNAPLGNLISKIIRPAREKLNEDLNTEVLSTEELQNNIEEFNEKNRKNEYKKPKMKSVYNHKVKSCIQKQDVKALFPAIMKEKTAKAIYESIIRSNIVFEEIYTELLRKYLALTCDDEELKREINDFLPKPRKKTTLKSFTSNPQRNQF